MGLKQKAEQRAVGVRVRPDIATTNHGTIIRLVPKSRRGVRWLNTHVAAQMLARDGYVAAEHRYGIDIIEGALAAGLRVRDVATGRFANRA